MLQKCAHQPISWQPLYIHQTCTIPGIQDDFNRMATLIVTNVSTHRNASIDVGIRSVQIGT